MGVKHRNHILDTDAEKATIRESFCECLYVTRPAANISSFRTLTHFWQMWNVTAHINTAGVIIAATWLLKAREILMHVCKCVCWCVSRGADREREWSQGKGRKKRCKVADCNFNWLRDECAKDSLYAFVFSAHMRLNLALNPSVSPALKWKYLSCP